MKYGAKMIAESTLEAVENDNPQRDYEIDFTIPEFTCLCPRSNFPDFATIRIRYIPDQKLVELMVRLHSQRPWVATLSRAITKELRNSPAT